MCITERRPTIFITALAILMSTLDVRHGHKSEKLKRLFHEVADFASISTPQSNANIHAAVATVSQVKKGWSSINFDGTLTDGLPKYVWLGLALSRERSWPLADGSQSVQLINCEIKQSCEGDKIEIILKEFTDIKESPGDIDICNLDPTDTSDTSAEISLDKIPKFQVFQHVTLAA